MKHGYNFSTFEITNTPPWLNTNINTHTHTHNEGKKGK